jgi:uncharacterized protein YgbK (DUF1537 family)
MNDLVLTFYGDDFTGSTDAMEQLELGGIPTVLFLDTPTSEQLARFPGIRGLGIAGTSRSMTPDQMEAELPPKFAALGELGAPFVHYKVCSTFDSSPQIGSIGRAADIGARLFEPKVTPLIVGAPFLRRYVVFGNLFARVDATTYRLDRHPTMSKHPTTPMDEADLRLHMGKQTTRQFGLVDVWHMMSMSADELEAYVDSLIALGDEIIVFDTLDETHLALVGRLLWRLRGDRPVFIVGSSGVELALVQHLQASGQLARLDAIAPPPPVEQLVVMSGSAAPETAAQIDYALARGYNGIRLDTVRLIDPALADAEREAVVNRALGALNDGHSVIMYATHGPDDPAIVNTRARLAELGFDVGSVGSRLGSQQGMILRDVLAASGLRRAVVTGGDTSGHTAGQLGIYALRVLMPIAPGAPLCVASSSDAEIDGLEISLKGGQNGKVDYFLCIQQGQA